MLQDITFRQLKNALEETQHHPRKLYEEANSSDNWRRIRQDVNYSDFWNSMLKQAAYLNENPVRSPLFSEFTLFGDTGNRGIFQTQRDHLYAGIHTFSMLAMTENNEEWKSGLENAIWNVCNEYTWVLPAHVGLYHNDYPNGIWDQPVPPRETVDLLSGITAFTLAETVYLLKERLHPWVVHRVKEEIDKRIFQVYFDDPTPQNWELKTNNWPAVCSASIGATAIYMIEDSEKLAGMLWRVIGVLRNFFSGFDEQGATPEGPAYWQFGFSYFVYFAELLKERTHGQISLLTDKKVERIAQFPQFCMLSGGKVVNFSDSPDEVAFNEGLIQRLQQYVPSLQLPVEEYQFKPVLGNWLDSTRRMLWSSSNTESMGFAESGERVQEQIFTGNQWVISKVRDARDGITAFAAKGGHNEEPHNHNDLGHFIIHVDGQNVLADLGQGVYTKQYFQPGYRYEMINAGSHGHSVPIVDGCRQGFGKSYYSEILSSQISTDNIHLVMDLTKAYACLSLELLTREFVWNRPVHKTPQLVIKDNVLFNKVPESFQEVFISSVQPMEIRSGRIQMNSVTLIYDPEQWQLEIEHILLDSPSKTDNLFFRIVLNRTQLEREMVSEFLFEL
ncbi:heparinase II/III family protein [Paenibacillus macquariensis]|uniref:Heparinase II/III-like protein n=2 Tax=Paenibacillus macquariensis TaxID=948756 RepID=A0ABY1JKV6_9BACL|nr:heparinase II/III family protein [Paenibacillus macquariensis]MEC0090014.1 heparinase II/III family protein [Paenibacillus macquariensis]OAB31102.1 hypothetical protein PMSM_20475 [Paenibacillus macquariensis subsp. macquariensis]SIQ36116.1 Heparinase II/III-like protein [Paenibacillus macquariensis]